MRMSVLARECVCLQANASAQCDHELVSAAVRRPTTSRSAATSPAHSHIRGPSTAARSLPRVPLHLGWSQLWVRQAVACSARNAFSPHAACGCSWPSAPTTANKRSSRHHDPRRAKLEPHKDDEPAKSVPCILSPGAPCRCMRRLVGQEAAPGTRHLLPVHERPECPSTP